MKGIALLPQIPIRAEYSHKAEMVNQILFGETYTVIDNNDKWLLIKTDYDDYLGWIDKLAFNEYPEDKKMPKEIIPSLMTLINRNGNKFMLSAGSSVETIKDNSFSINNNNFYIEELISPLNSTNIIDIAKAFIGVPYLWGGRTILGFDCSGFTQVVYKIYGKAIPRDASAQAKIGRTIPIIQEAPSASLAFFGDNENIDHVGIIINQNTIIHCSGHVRIDKIDNVGIHNGKRYTHFLRTIKAIITKKTLSLEE